MLPDSETSQNDHCPGAQPCEGLHEYADFYAETYGGREEVAELIPFMLEAFSDDDVDFRRLEYLAYCSLKDCNRTLYCVNGFLKTLKQRS
jgi:hypothetical protein